MKLDTTKTGGFTLVEILIVVAIIGLLLSAAIPNFVKARTSSRSNVCIANLKQLRDVKIRWAMENKKTATDLPVDGDLFGVDSYLAQKPDCPGGGTYELQAVDGLPTCTLAVAEGHSL